MNFINRGRCDDDEFNICSFNFINRNDDKGSSSLNVNNGPGSDPVSTSTPPKTLSYHQNENEYSSQDATNFEKFKLLLWKNYKLQIRNKLQTFFEVMLPICFTILVVVVR